MNDAANKTKRGTKMTIAEAKEAARTHFAALGIMNVVVCS